MEIKQAVEAILFVCDDPISETKLRDLLPDVKPAEIKEAITALRSDYESGGRAFSLEEVADGYQLLTRPQYADIIARLKKSRVEKKLSAAALETLAIIAYKQPIKRADLEAIRGVASGEVLRALMERNLVKIVGRENVPGAPVQYGTTKEFLEVFGLRSIEDLPRPEEMK